MTGNYTQEITHNCDTNNLSGITMIIHSSYYMLPEHVHCTVIQRPCYLTETLLKGIVLCEPFLQLYGNTSPRREHRWERQHLRLVTHHSESEFMCFICMLLSVRLLLSNISVWKCFAGLDIKTVQLCTFQILYGTCQTQIPDHFHQGVRVCP